MSNTPVIDASLRAAARRAFARYGYSGATVERIAQEAGLSRVTLHRRGIDREALLGALAEDAADAYRRALWPALTSAGSGRERLEAALTAICATADRELDVLVALRARRDAVFHDAGAGGVGAAGDASAGDAGADDESGSDGLGTRAVFFEPLARLLRDGAADGSLRAQDDPDEVAVVLFNQVGGTYIHLRGEHGWSHERCRDALVQLTIQGLVSPST
ncbi:TetR/AcrR family transcriptional regulator [Conexibacter sp. JD483]|uniref:TetR/AcrR family transcriptional regulator n=1 Tax=unclassified Conexibacter TaxID=2627773 RepID=UPI002716C7F7|nr:MULTISPECIES: TetR/AcrR family transcriptional regulator [unclassified Conexibacter]MDO8186396.1 TetR/AcrR family transcriptional regulator [Conexibacter sp. CPCC 205706]MDO8199795.1 TetR/AcrR family transcriptional regulator [Conexibacter sp. CPCC 205762]MDR9369185.1 TetR/AcrR family transcriptional regulator [Conexibacter sp. JD483]